MFLQTSKMELNDEVLKTIVDLGVDLCVAVE